jgi:hypothetical protein
VNPARRRFFQGFAGPVNIGVGGAGQSADHAVLDRPRHRPHRLKIAGAGDGKTGLDHVDPHPLQHLGDADFFFLGHGRAGALFAVAQGRVENNQFVHAVYSGFKSSYRFRLNAPTVFIENIPDWLIGHRRITPE